MDVNKEKQIKKREIQLLESRKYILTVVIYTVSTGIVYIHHATYCVCETLVVVHDLLLTS
jgi:hypothetical protein